MAAFPHPIGRAGKAAGAEGARLEGGHPGEVLGPEWLDEGVERLGHGLPWAWRDVRSLLE